MKLRTACTTGGTSASSVIRSASASFRWRWPSESGSGHASERSPAVASSCDISSTSRRTGAQIRTFVFLSPSMGGILVTSALFLLIVFFVREDRNARQHAAELPQRLSDGETVRRDLQLPDRRFVRAAALLDDRDRFPHFAVRLEVADQDHAVGE